MNSKFDCFVSLYQSYPSYHGASDITYNLFKAWPNKFKNLIQVSKTNKKMSNIINVKHKFGLIGMLINLFIISITVKKKLRNYKNKRVIIEGASWAGYIYLLIKILNYLVKDLIIIYHSHNLEYEVRKYKNSKLVRFFTFYFEKFIYQNSIGTTVSSKDKRFVKANYKRESILFENFVNPTKPKKILNKNIIKNKFIFFCGSYTYWPNRIAFNNIIKNQKIISKKFPKIKFVFTGEGFPKMNDKNVINLNIVDKSKLVWLYKNCLFFYAPLPKAPGTKIKILEAIYYGSTLLCSNHSLTGINKINNINFLFTINNQLQKRLDYIKSQEFHKIKKNNSKFISYYNINLAIKKFNDKLYKKYTIKI